MERESNVTPIAAMRGMLVEKADEIQELSALGPAFHVFLREQQVTTSIRQLLQRIVCHVR